MPLALAGMFILLRRAETRPAAVPVSAFALAYFYVLASHSQASGIYALPLVPILCVLSAIAAWTLIEYLAGLSRFRRYPAAARAVALAVMVVLLWPPTAAAVRWLDQYKRADTRVIAAEWLKANAPKGSRVATENSGPTYLDAAGFRVARTERLLEHPVDWYRTRADFLVISSADLSRYADYVAAGPTVFQIAPTAQRWGPPIQVVRLSTPKAQFPTPK